MLCPMSLEDCVLGGDDLSSDTHALTAFQPLGLTLWGGSADLSGACSYDWCLLIL